MSEYECVVPEMEWNLMRQQQQQTHVQVDQQNINTRSSHLRPQHNLLDPFMTNNVEQIEELTWENGQPLMHGRRKPVWPGSKDTLESIVHQASHNNINPIYVSKMGDENNNKLFITSGQKICVETDEADESSILMMMKKKKRTRSESEQCGTNNTSLFSKTSSYSKGGGGDDHCYNHQQGNNIGASGSATFCKDEEDTTMMTWASFDSPTTFNTKKTFQHAAAAEDSASLGISANQDEDGKTRTDQTGRSTSSRRSSRVAANHNQSERRRRDRINQKMRALQRLVPNAYKTDKASMLDEVIEYLKQLQAQVETAMSMRNMNNNVPHFTMMPLGIAQAQQQQQLQLSLFSRMVGLGMGMGGMLDSNSVARAVAAQPLMHPAPSSAVAPLNFIPPHFNAQQPPPPVVPLAHPTVPEIRPHARNNSPSLPLPDPAFTAFLAQNMNIDLYNKMAALYRQQQMGSPSTTHQLATREQ